jgi:hypothetical protein
VERPVRTTGRPVTARPPPSPGTPRTSGGPRRRKRKSRLPRWARRSLVVGAWTLGPLLALTLIVAGGLYFRLTQGPISLQPLVRSIEAGISADLDGLTAKIDDALVVMGEQGLEFRLRNLQLAEADGDLVASAPLASAAVSATGLLRLRIIPTRVYLIEPRLFLFYSDEGGLALSFSNAKDDEAAAAGIVAPAPVPAQRPNSSSIPKTVATAAPSERIDVAKKLIDVTARARRGMKASSELREIGLKDASVVLVFAGQTSEWRVPQFVVDLEHSKRNSMISGSGAIDSGQGAWNFAFQTQESTRSNTVKLKLSVEDFVPSSLAAAVPRLGLFKTLDMRVAGEGSLDLTSSGSITSARLDLAFGQGNINLPQVEKPLHIDTGNVRLGYDGASQRVTVEPSTIAWGQSRITLQGGATQSGDTASGDTKWTYDVRAKEGVLAAEDLGVAPVPVEALEASGYIEPKAGIFQLTTAVLRAGGGELQAHGEITAGATSNSTRLEGRIANLGLQTVKTLWPRAFASSARTWVGSKLQGDVLSGSIKVLSGDYLAQEGGGGPGRTDRTTYAMEAANLKAKVIDGMQPLSAPRALIRGENDTLEITIPEASLPTAAKGGVQVKAAKFTAADLGSVMPMGELTLRMTSTVPALIEVTRAAPDSPLAGVELPVETADGKVDGQFTVKLPLIETLQKHDVKVAGKARVSDIKVKPKTGRVEVQSGTVNLDMSETTAEAKGELILNGVLAKLQWQHVLDVPEGMQSPVKITARLDNSDRTQLGLDVNHMVQGDVPVEITVARGNDGRNAVHLKADLTASELIVEEVAWRKPADRKCVLELDVGQTRPDGRVELQNFTIAGDDIAIEGNAILDPDNEMREFSFPKFSLGLVSRIELTGRQNANDKIWTIKAKGPTFDGRSFFDSLFSLGRVGEAQLKPLRPANGSDVEAEIGTVLGWRENALKNFRLKMSTRKDKIVAMDASGSLDNGKTFKAVVPQNKGPRKLFAESNDAGRMFKIVGFYPNAENGQLRMEVDLDGSGPAEKTGELVVENFQILGEPVFTELASSGQGEQRVQRQVTDFDRMRVPFSVGHGQFVLSKSYLRGPVLGMSMHGKIDYKLGRVTLEGTYIPLQGINAALCGIPIFGQIVAGANCEGVLGINFLVQGSNKNPEVVVNPLSLVTPGIFRDIFQMTSPNPKVQARDEEKPAQPAGERTRASSTGGGASSGSKKDRARPAGAPAIDGWSQSSETVEPNKKKR